MKTYRLRSQSSLLPHVLLDLLIMFDDRRQVVKCWTPEGGSYPLSDRERVLLSQAHALRALELVKDHALPNVSKA